MPRSSRRQFIQLLTVVTAAGLLPKDETIVEAKGKKAPSLHVDEARPVVSRHKIVTTAPPSHIPKATSADALFLGNGDLLAAFAGEAHQPQFWVTTNDFWELREWGGPRPLGRIIFEMPELANAKYDCSLDLVSATLTATFTSGAVVVTMASWIAADTNLLVVEFACSGGSVDGQVSFCFPDEIGYGVAANDYWNYSGSTLDRLNHLPFQEKQWANGLLSADRTYNIETDQVSRLTMAARFIEPSAAPGGDGKFHLKQDSKITFTAVFRSWFKTVRPLDAVRYAASTISAADILDHRKQHQQWWDRYWSTSIVEIPDPTIELQYYRSHYNMGSLSRDPDFPPCDYGLSTSDDPVSCADYKIDYNYQAGFLGLNVAGRFEQTVVYDSPGLAHLPRACADAVKLLGHGGAYMSLGLGPRGMVPEHIWLGMKSQNAFYLVNTAERWYLTRDIEYARRVYPLVREVARFWEQDLTLVKGHYPVIDDSGQEMTGHHCVNNSAGIAFVQLAMRLALDISAQLNVDADTHDLWRHILANVGPLPIRDAGTLHSVFSSPGMDLQNIFPKGSLKGKPIIAFEGEGIDYSFEGIQTFPIYPAGQIGLSSDPKLLQAAHNTVGLRVWSEDSGNKWPGPKPGDIGGGAWFDSNTGCLFITAAVRIGYDPEVIWSKLHEWCENRVWPNGFRANINNGIENYGAIPNAVHEMMLLSHENILRFFRVWPRKSAPNARFENLWAYGAFKVSSSLKAGHVEYVKIVSEKGSDLTFENPWPGKTIKVSSSAAAPRSLAGDKLSLKTGIGDVITLTPG